MSGTERRSLRDVQTWMVGAITGTAADAPAKDVERWVTHGPQLSASERFEVYRSGYRARLVECLLDDYPVLAAMLGDEAFEALCHAYIARHPSASPNLNGFGRYLPSFCREAPVLDALEMPRPFAFELASLEWALVEVLHARTNPPLDVSLLQTMPPEAWATARFVRSDAMRFFRFAYPVNAAFIANRFDGIVPEVPEASPTALVVVRKDTTIWRLDLTPPMANVLEPLLAGRSLGEAIEALEAKETDPARLQEAAANLMVWFRDWVDAALFTRIELAR